MKLDFICDNCGIIFKRCKSAVRGKTRSCSNKCRFELAKIINKGEGNPNYKGGIHCTPSLCSCGRRKDYRAVTCSICSNVSFPINPDDRVSDISIISAIPNNNSYYAVARELNVSRARVRDVSIKYSCDISHFCCRKERPATYNDIFKISDKRDNYRVRKYILKEELLEYKCEQCGIYDEWNGKKLTLELDHINGNKLDNTFENLRFLCPNCHSQTNTYKGRNKYAYKTK